MESNEFIDKYESFLEDMRLIIKPEFLTVIDELINTGPHDFVTAETYLMTENQARIHVWHLFLQRTKLNSSPE